jgi:hypothetical protein
MGAVVNATVTRGMEGTMRYLNVILTVIALELLWLGLMHTGSPVAAQTGATRVVITGVEVDGAGAFLPVGVVGAYQRVPRGPVALGPLSARIDGPVKVEADRPIRIQSDRPLLVESVPYTPGQRPGE